MSDVIQIPVRKPTRTLTVVDRGEGLVRRLAPAARGDAVPPPAPAGNAGPAAVPGGGAPVPGPKGPLRIHLPRLAPKRSALAAPSPNVQRRIPGIFYSRRYKPEKVIGQGGRGAVYKAWDNVLGIHVALKFLPEGLALQPEAVEEIRREAVVTMRLAHENIVRLHTIEMTGQRLFLVMEYVEGENLREILDRVGPLAPSSVSDIARSCASALAYAHRIGIVHRDLKPENVMIDKDSVLKIVDFGTAMMVRSPGKDTYLEGTPGYMSPEQIRGGEPVDARADVFSFGAVMAELLTGKRAFVYDGDVQHLLAARPQGLDGLAPEVRDVLVKAMEPDREARWASAVHFCQALTHALEVTRAGG